MKPIPPPEIFEPSHVDRAQRTLAQLIDSFDVNEAGSTCHDWIRELYPICRSITGNGVRESLRLLKKHVPLSQVEVPTGTPVFDWVVPKEWTIRDAWIKNAAGEKVVDFQESNLHVLSYSTPLHQKMSLETLRPNLFTLPESPDWIPYRTSYFRERWGFCLSQRQLDSMDDGEYEVCVDSTLEEGHLTYGEFRIQGRTDDEILLSCHVCHPSLCNDNLSGVTVAAWLAQALQSVDLRYSYRFLWIPGTIGSITWLAQNETVLPRIKNGLVISCVGDSGGFTYKRSRRHNAEIDRAVEHVLQHSGSDYEVVDFIPYGYDERQYCSPGINLPVGCFMRTPNGKFPQYHTSADDLNLVTPGAIGESIRKLLEVIQLLESNATYQNLNPKCEPQLGRRGLYRQIGGVNEPANLEMAMLWVLNMSDGQHTLLEIAEHTGMPFGDLAHAARLLSDAGLLKPQDSETVENPGLE